MVAESIRPLHRIVMSFHKIFEHEVSLWLYERLKGVCMYIVCMSYTFYRSTGPNLNILKNA